MNKISCHWRHGRFALVAIVALMGAMVIPSAQGQVVAREYQSQLQLSKVVNLPNNPTQMAWGLDGRLYVMTSGGVFSYAYNKTYGRVSDMKSAMPYFGGIGIAFHNNNMYVTTGGSIYKLDDKNGNGIWGEPGELNVPIVTGIPIGDHDVDQLQVSGDTLYVGIGRRTINGHKGDYTSGSLDDFGGTGFWSGGLGDTWGDGAYNGTISWIKDLNAVADTPGAANVYPSTGITQSLIQQDSSPYTTVASNKLIVHSAGTRNPFGLCLDRSGNLWFTNNFNRTQTMGNGESGFGYLYDSFATDYNFNEDVHDQVFKASPGADYGYFDANWRGVNPMMTPSAPNYHRVLSTTFDNLFNTGPYPTYDPANPSGLGPSASADGCSFFYSPNMPAKYANVLFIARYNNTITNAANQSLTYGDVVGVDTKSGQVRRVAYGFNNALALLWDGADRLLVADYSVPANPNGTGSIYALHILPK